ncbi:magnesium transporter [Weissella viridescens]|uniref:magnesium transporter n=1 Tax=Weissella viridescens TaxID=1629 RepID=UPI001D0845C3|nr:magnesium transporter [Weissella viridescens]MCB6840759.1 magnesium transporter [Weissella viridescens]MCB6847524.1 magnesium transporter [Weissella viridescens]
MANENNNAEEVVEDLRDEISEQAQALVNDLEHGDKEAFLDGFADLHGYDRGQFYLNLPSQLRQQVIDWLTPSEMAEVFDEMPVDDDTKPDELLKEMSPQYAAEMLDQMYTDNSVDMLEELSGHDLRMYLSLMPEQDAKSIRELLNYDDETAGSLMSHDYIAINENDTIPEAMQAVKVAAKEAEQITYIYVLNADEKLVGVVSLRSLMLADDSLELKDIMDTNLIAVGPDEDQEEVAHIMADYNFSSLPVVENDKLLGIIMVDDIVDVIGDEATEDYSRLAGVDVESGDDNPLKAAFKRLPWLIGLIFLGMGTASVIDGFNGLVATAPILAVFISLITGTAGNAGTQSLAVAVRKLAFKSTTNVWKMLLNEILIGCVIGIVAGLTIFTVVTVWKHNVLLGLAVGLAMGIAILVANVAGAFIPLIMDAIHVDPAVASGPFISTLSDLTSVLIYFNIAGLFIHLFGAI